MSIAIISIILTRDHRSDPSGPWLQTSTAFMPTHPHHYSFHHSSPVIVQIEGLFARNCIRTGMVKWILCSLVVGCTCLFMILYQYHSLERSYMSLMKMEMKMILMQSLAVGSKLHSLWNDTPVTCVALSLSLLPISLKWKSTHFFSHAALVVYALITKVCLKKSTWYNN